MTHATVVSTVVDHHNSLKLKKKNFILFWPQHVAAATTKTPEKLPFPLMNNNNSLKLKTSDPRQPQLTCGHLTAPQTAAPSPCTVIHVAAASNAASNLTTMLMIPLSHAATSSASIAPGYAPLPLPLNVMNHA